MILLYYNGWLHFTTIMFAQHRLRQQRLYAQIFAEGPTQGQQQPQTSLLGVEARKAHRKKRRFWTRPGRTSAWRSNFEKNIVVSEEWVENFRMSCDSFYHIADELRPFLTSQQTNMCKPLSVENN